MTTKTPMRLDAILPRPSVTHLSELTRSATESRLALIQALVDLEELNPLEMARARAYFVVLDWWTSELDPRVHARFARDIPTE